jgi:prepilin-type N-terminal cleavage/methylation domain-containing protein
MKSRRGFTLVEMLVATALVLFIMVILTEAFVTGLESFRQLKAAGDLQEKMRSVQVILRRDLAAAHFGTAPNLSLSSQDLTLPAPPSAGSTWQPPAQGFFRIWQGSNPAAATNYISEGTDPDGLPSFRATDHILHFTINLSQPQQTGRLVAPDTNRRENFLTAAVPLVPPALPPDLSLLGPIPDFRATGTYTAQWAEVAYYLRRAPGAPTANGTPLFALYRRQAVIPDGDATTLNTAPRTATTPPSNPSAAPEDGQLVEMSCKDDLSAPGSLSFNSATKITIPERRFGMQIGTIASHNLGGIPIALTDPGTGLPISPTSYPTFSDQLAAGAAQIGDDLLVTDVVSFEIKVFAKTMNGPPKSYTSDFVSLYDASILAKANNTNLNPAGPMFFDTWSMMSMVSDGTYDYSSWASATASPTTVPLKINILALQIILRVWDARTQQTRQVTIIQDM